MKIERLTDDKIRVLFKSEEFCCEDEEIIDIHTAMSKIIEPEGMFLDILETAEMQVGFYADDCKLLIEGNESADNDFIFTITKYAVAQPKSINKKSNGQPPVSVSKKTDDNIYDALFNSMQPPKKKFCIDSNNPDVKKFVATPKRVRSYNIDYKLSIFSFESFDAFCDLCSYIGNSKFPINKLAGSIVLYEFNGDYYMFMKDINSSVKYAGFFSLIAEFGNSVGRYSEFFEFKIKEHGNTIFKHNALASGIKYLA